MDEDQQQARHSPSGFSVHSSDGDPDDDFLHPEMPAAGPDFGDISDDPDEYLSPKSPRSPAEVADDDDVDMVQSEAEEGNEDLTTQDAEAEEAAPQSPGTPEEAEEAALQSPGTPEDVDEAALQSPGTPEEVEPVPEGNIEDPIASDLEAEAAGPASPDDLEEAADDASAPEDVAGGVMDMVESEDDMDNSVVQDGEMADAGPVSPSSPREAEETGTGAAAAAEGDGNADLVDPEEQNNLIADIFGDSDDEGGDFLGFDVDAMAAAKRHHSGDDSDSDPGVIDPHPRRGHSTAGLASDDDDVVEDDRSQPNASGMSDFDLMMAKKKAGRKKKRKTGDAITGMDDYICSFIREMRAASEEDIHLNDNKKAATKKLKMLPTVMRCIQQSELQMDCVRLGVLSVISNWLSPLPDGSLPHITIRDSLIAWLCSLPELGQDTLKTSNVGKSAMYLYRHPKETRENRQRLGKLINNWSRMIFGLQSNYEMSRDEREERDYLQMRKRQQSADKQDEESEQSLLGETGQSLKPGDRGFVGRARVPMASNKDYIVRPKWNVDKEGNRKSKKEPNRFEKQQLKHKQEKQFKKIRQAATISLVGTKMAL